MSSQFEDFRENVNKLEPNGEVGFEGLMAAVLTKLTRRGFVLASSGSQHGRDGQSLLDGGAIVFEAKRYDKTINKEQLLTKIAEIAVDLDRGTELFIVGATTHISVQIENSMHDSARTFGVSVLSLAWSKEGLPILATVLAMASDVTLEFLLQHTDAEESDLRDQLDRIRNHLQFADRSTELRRLLDQPSIAPAFALEENIAYLTSAFSDVGRARSEFGQALSPSDPKNIKTLDRVGLRTSIFEQVFRKRDGNVAVILGADGNGKSWVFAQTWSALENKPLTLFIVPNDITDLPTAESCEALLLKKLLAQTNDAGLNGAELRWKRHFRRWRQHATPATPRLVVFIDGINQRDTFEWIQFLDAMASVVDELGGNLVFSCRHQFYLDRIRGRMYRQVTVVEVPEWSNDELNELLAAYGASIYELDAAVVRSLRNPRIFGVAAKLFSSVEIRSFKEVSVSRLLFEHTRSGIKAGGTEISPKEFAAMISAHARKILQRIESKETEDLTEFDLSDPPSVGAIDGRVSTQSVVSAAMRIFEVVDEDPGKYLLKEEGLPLALGLALLQKAQEAHRKKKSIAAALASLLDPIEALDQTSGILLGAILAGVIQETNTAVIGHLVSAFVRLQNVHSRSYPEFCNLFRRDPASFLTGLELCALGEDPVANFSWLVDATNDLRRDAAVETFLKQRIRRWLDMYSLVPNQKMLAAYGRDPSEQARIRQRESEKIEKAVESLSPLEAELLSRMHHEESGNYSELSSLALRLLAGRPLAPFAENLRNWCLATALNHTYGSLHHTFNSLLQFNVSDWSDARIALRQCTDILQSEGASPVGQWAVIYALAAGGDSGDIAECERIAESILGPQGESKTWRRIESYCATDPCDPDSAVPENFDDTVQEIAAIDPNMLYAGHGGRTAETWSFETAKTGMARFATRAAVDVIRRLADSAHGRPLQGFREVIRELDDHTVCLESSIAEPYVRKAWDISQQVVAAGGIDTNNDGLFSSQAALCTAFPHMSGTDQLAALIKLPGNKTIFLDLAYLFKPVSGKQIEEALQERVAQDDAVGQFRVMSFADFSQTPLTPEARQLVGDLHRSENGDVRLSALSLIRTSEDRGLLDRLVREGWTAASLDSKIHAVEIQNGSRAMVLAAAQGLIDLEACLDRIAKSEYGLLVESFGADAVKAVASRIAQSMGVTAVFKWNGSLPPLEHRVSQDPRVTMLDIHLATPRASREARLEDARDGRVGWREQLREDEAAFDNFSRIVQQASADLILQHLPNDLVAEIIRVEPAIVDRWAADILNVDDRALRNLHNLALVIAQEIATRDESISLALFKRLEGRKGFTNIYFGLARVPLERVALWTAAREPAIRAFLFEQLDQITSDHGLALEVGAAMEADRLDVLKAYVVDRRSRIEPAYRARSAMLAGLSPCEEWALETVAMLKDEKGFLGDAYDAAKYAMERHQWSVHWANDMRTATDPIRLWGSYILLSKIVDGRFSWSELGDDSPSPLIRAFGPTFRSSVESRISKWKQKRQSMLFGAKIVDEIFLGARSLS